MYTKIFAQIFDGTLCSKGPWQALVTFEQFLILADQDGTVDITASAISRRTTIPLDIIEMGIAALMEPDPQSRSPAFEGRRIVPLSSERNWGWTIVNYVSYSNIRSEDERREAKRKWDRENRPHHRNPTRPDSVPTRPDRSRQVPTVPAHTDTDIKPLRPSRDGQNGFVHFWAAYPNKQKKKRAIDAWDKLKPDAAMLETMLKVIEAQKHGKDWLKDGGQFIPHPTTWLNDRRWEDELKLSEQSKWAGYSGDKVPT